MIEDADHDFEKHDFRFVKHSIKRRKVKRAKDTRKPANRHKMSFQSHEQKEWRDL
jgi:hypothetical protein